MSSREIRYSSHLTQNNLEIVKNTKASIDRGAGDI
jgi:hypothetical protein